MEKYKYIIIGSGPAGITAAKYIQQRCNDKDELLVITNETRLYNRIFLVDYIFDKISPDKITYSKDITKNLNILLSKEVTKVDTNNKFLITKDGEKYGYHKLIISCGAKPVIENPQWLKYTDYVFCLRTVEDAESIKLRIKDASCITIVGCGAAGIELLDGITQCYPDKKVIVIEKNSWVLASLLKEQPGKWFTKEVIGLLKNNNVKFIFNTTVKKIQALNSKISVELTNSKKFFTEMLIFTTGVLPNMLVRNNSVDEYCRSKYSDVYICGDAAIVKNKYYPNFINAIRTAITVSKNVLGENVKVENYEQVNIIEVFEHVIYIQNFKHEIKDSAEVKLNNKNFSIKQFITTCDSNICSILSLYRNYIDIKHIQTLSQIPRLI